MRFSDSVPIFQQIAERLAEQILQGDFTAGDKFPSVREVAAQLGVNPNTVQRAFAFLQQRKIIATRRGLGYYVEDEAANTITALKKETLYSEILPNLCEQLHLLDISVETFSEKLRQYMNRPLKEKP